MMLETLLLHSSMQGEDIILSILMESVMCLHFHMRAKDLSTLMPCVIYVNFSQLVNHCVT